MQTDPGNDLSGNARVASPDSDKLPHPDQVENTQAGWSRWRRTELIVVACVAFFAIAAAVIYTLLESPKQNNNVALVAVDTATPVVDRQPTEDRQKPDNPEPFRPAPNDQPAAPRPMPIDQPVANRPTALPDDAPPPREFKPVPRRPDPVPEVEQAKADHAEPPLTTLPEKEQQRVEKAIDRGVAYLKKSQLGNGSWTAGEHHVGKAALPGLTLLECGVPADDPAVRKAAAYVRAAVPKLGKTYELALAILFLDRLGDPSDRPLIQTLALRLIAGQSSTGGWTYDCPILSSPEEKQLLTALQQLSPQLSYDLIAPTMLGTDPSYSMSQIENQKPVIDKQVKPAPSPGLLKPSAQKVVDSGKVPPSLMNTLSRTLQGVAVLQDLSKAVLIEPPKRKKTDPRPPVTIGDHVTDNSNTQFAMLGLWAARRHEVPMDRTATLIVKRFRMTQNRDGSWGYRYETSGHGEERATMDCVGLLGLAIGHGIAQDFAEGRPDAGKPSAQDPQIQKGLKALAKFIGSPVGKLLGVHQQNLYFLWSVERVGVLYSLKTIGGKDWYRWGAEMLCANQVTNGSWKDGNYHGSVSLLDTCFALLFLKRANLAKDLTVRLEMLTLEGK